MLTFLFWVLRLIVFGVLLSLILWARHGVGRIVLSYINQEALSGPDEGREQEAVHTYVQLVSYQTMTIAVFMLLGGLALFTDSAWIICATSALVVASDVVRCLIIEVVALRSDWKTDWRLIYHDFTSRLVSSGKLSGKKRQRRQEDIVDTYGEENWLVSLGLWAFFFFLVVLVSKLAPLS